MTPRIDLPPLAAPVDELWHVLLDLADVVREPWTLIGGQMVLLHALEHGRMPPQVSQDGDVVVDVRASSQALRRMVATLENAGFELEAITTDGRAHRYTRPAAPRPVIFDVLAPEGLSAKTSLVTSPPGHTVSVPGGTQALARTERVEVQHEHRQASLPRPSLLAALVLKSAACALPGNPARHLRDLALLYSLPTDPIAMVDELNAKDRQRLRRTTALNDHSHEAWFALPQELARLGQQARELLLS